MSEIQAIVFDVGRVIVRWNLRCLYEKLIADEARLDWFLENVVTEKWHYQHDAGRDLAEMVAERKADFPEFTAEIDAYATRFLETIPGDVPGTSELIRRLAARDVPIFGLTNFAAPFWQEFRPTRRVFDHFDDIVVSGVEKCAKPHGEIYALAERRYGHAAEGLFFIDDSPANIAAAHERGWQGHVFTDAEALERELVARELL